MNVADESAKITQTLTENQMMVSMLIRGKTVLLYSQPTVQFIHWWWALFNQSDEAGGSDTKVFTWSGTAVEDASTWSGHAISVLDAVERTRNLISMALEQKNEKNETFDAKKFKNANFSGQQIS